MQAQHRPLLRRGGRSFFLDIPSYRTSPLIGLIDRVLGGLSAIRTFRGMVVVSVLPVRTKPQAPRSLL